MPFDHLTLPDTDPTFLDSAIINAFSPPVKSWWQSRFKNLSRAQRLAIPTIAAGQNTLICAPTGTGTTLSASSAS